MLVSLDHPGIIRVLDYNLELEQPFYAMPWMERGSLTSLAGNLPPDSIRAIFRRLVSVLADLHARGLVHRDVKPDNVLVAADGTFQVGDFGLGNGPGCTMIYTLHARGTPGYTAPELVHGYGDASTASDMFSLGATLFHLATGTRPDGRWALDVSTIRPDAPADLRKIVLQLTALDPASRPVAAELVAANEIRSTERPRLPAKRGTFLADLGSVAVTGLLIAGAFEIARDIFGGRPKRRSRPKSRVRRR